MWAKSYFPMFEDNMFSQSTEGSRKKKKGKPLHKSLLVEMEQFISDNYPLVFYPGVFTQPGLMLDSGYALTLLKKGYSKFKTKAIKHKQNG